MQEPVAVLVDRRPVAVDPDVRPSRPVGREVALGVAPDPARHRRPGFGADQLADSLLRSGWPSASYTSTAIPSDGPTSEHGFSGVVGKADSRQAPTSVPPVMLMIGQRPRPTVSNSQRHDSGSHGSPVEARMRSRRQVVRSHRFDAVLDQGRDERWRDAQDRHRRAARPSTRAGRAPGSRARPRRGRPCPPRPARRPAPTAP